MNRAPTLEGGLTPEIAASIRTSLDGILASKAFQGSERLRRFLRFVVEQRLLGEAETIKEYVVAVEVFDKDSSFDSRVDPIVRVEAGRLRSKLREYYETEGGADPIKIALPKGGYVPGFQTCNAQAVLGEACQGSLASQTLSHNSIPSGNGFSLPGNGAVADPESDLPHLEQNPTVSIRPRETDEAKQKYRPAWIPATLAVLLLMASIAYWINKQPAIETSDRPVVAPFTTYLGTEWDPSFSPDGNQVAFVWSSEKDDNLDIYVKQIGSEPPRRLTTNPDRDLSPAWSPDGQFIAFVRHSDKGDTAVMLIPANGGRERQLAALKAQKQRLECRWLCWHPNGDWLAVPSDQDSSEAPSAIYVLSPKTGEKRRLTAPPTGIAGDTNPAFSSDGRTLAFVRFFGSDSFSEIYVLPVTDGLLPAGEPKQLTFGNQWTVTPTWAPDGRDIIYASGANILSVKLWRILATGSGEPRPLAFSGQQAALDPAISPASLRLVYRDLSLDFSIWRSEIPGGKREPARQSRLVPSTKAQSLPQYSPDGEAIAYISHTSGSGEVWVCNRDGSSPLQLTHFGGPPVKYPKWSPDGLKIVFSGATNARYHLYVVPATGGPIRQLTRTAFNEGNPSYSRDGKWVYFQSNRSQSGEVWRMPAEGGEATQLTRRGGHAPQESMDGKLLFYWKGTDTDFGELWKLPAEGGTESQVVGGVLRANFDVKQQGIYYVAQPDGNGTQFLYYDFATAKSKHVSTTEHAVFWGFTVSPDEKSILSTQMGALGGSDLVLVENFQ